MRIFFFYTTKSKLFPHMDDFHLDMHHHSGIRPLPTSENLNRKRALQIIAGPNYTSYTNALNQLRIPSLETT